jgi:hemerythrin
MTREEILEKVLDEKHKELIIALNYTRKVALKNDELEDKLRDIKDFVDNIIKGYDKI